MRYSKRSRNLSFHIMLLPAVIITFIYSYIPMFGISIAFQDYQPTLGFFHSKNVGWDNFKFIFHMPDIFSVIRNTFLISFGKMVGMMIIPVVFALLLNEVKSRLFKRSVQSILYLPHFLSWIILAAMFIDVLSPSSGIVNKLLMSVGLKPVFFLGDASVFPYTMIVTDVWKGFGFGTIVYLAALTSIDPTLYESAYMDGAGHWNQLWYITLPGLLPMIILMTVLSLGNILNAGFDQIFNLYSPLVYTTGDILDTMVYRMGVQQALYSISTAIGLFKSVVSFVFISLSYLLAYKVANYRIF